MKKITLSIAFASLIGLHHMQAQSTNPAPYCDASFDDAQGFFVDDHINTVSFGTINNNSGSQFAAPHYVFYNNLSVANFVRGNNYTLDLNMTTAGGCGYGVWIDFNQNNSFETTEKIAGTTNNMLPVGGAATVNQSILIPLNAVLGNTRMRVRIVEDDFFTQGTNFNILPCNVSTSATDVMDWGETEDYSINITTATDLNDNFLSNTLMPNPNPVTSAIAFNQQLTGAITYKIFNLQGQEIQYGTMNVASEKIMVSTLSDGIYILKLFDEHHAIAQHRFVKQME